MTYNERDIIRIFRGDFGIGSAWDDVERIRIGDTDMAVNIDTLVRGTDVPESMSLREAARKSVIACASDFAAKGVRPLWGLVSVGMPSTYKMSDFKDVSGGLADASMELGCHIVGGDTKQCAEMSITVCLLGKGRPGPLRSGAHIHDAVFVSGPFGMAGAGLYMLLNDMDGPATYAQSVLRPTIPLEFGMRSADYMTSSMDSSDGLSTTLNEMAAQSGTSIIVTDEPIADGIKRFAVKSGLSMRDIVYNSGEEYEIVFTAQKRDIPKLYSIASETGTPLTQIGFVREGSGVYIEKDGQTHHIRDKGWQSF
ncbi:MAG: thiamine-phosphate kinase [Cenarchaeum sp. SB0665_bin_23]|nr:thiamine-phosphate kinase [Cenarchaeum sp. SB0665_bin_23]MYB46421.1 thiamine-phosphate kinase [Cenarchaeum sp. SB0662_bin_33]MYG33467.1 thiamine-phosphate kinase [Cenarchaeum sp. SB0677_bin_16]